MYKKFVGYAHGMMNQAESKGQTHWQTTIAIRSAENINFSYKMTASCILSKLLSCLNDTTNAVISLRLLPLSCNFLCILILYQHDIVFTFLVFLQDAVCLWAVCRDGKRETTCFSLYFVEASVAKLKSKMRAVSLRD